MTVEEERRVSAKRGHHRRADGEVRHEVPVHDVDVEPVGRRRHLAHLFGQRPEVRREHRRGDPDRPTGPGSRRWRGGIAVGGDVAHREPGPAQDAPEAVEVGLSLSELLEQALPVAVDERGEELGRESGAVGREEGSHDPLDDVGRRGELVAVDLHAHDLLLRSELIEQIGIDLGREDEAAPVSRSVLLERVDEGRFVGHLQGQEVRRVAKIRRDLERDLPTLSQSGAHPGQQVEMIVDPLQRGVGEHQIEILTEPRLDIAQGKRQTRDVSVIGVGARQHRLGGVDPDGFGRLHPRMQFRREVTGATPKVDHPTARNGLTKSEQIVEGLASLGVKALVLIRVPALNRSHGHRTHV